MAFTKLIADSGATKAEWWLIGKGSENNFYPGNQPLFLECGTSRGFIEKRTDSQIKERVD